ncbi:unnamed protein product [Adineta ricciae]|uniref:Uncharacterized protein n=1 Tax=Adineta ricciae TaxID=249248 RepID=A0A815MRZ4_ADIRI|nr:unnamed protein product [Adineta ricciae]CAF1424391.1 unnamed protein product [Adineta ricciae]
MSTYSNFFRSFVHFGSNQQRWKVAAMISSVGLTTAALLWQNQQHHASSYSLHLKRYSAIAEYPQLHKHSNLMARHLTPQLYAKLRDRITSSGYTIDDVIQVGVDNPRSPNGQYFGVTAGDEESYRMFSDLFNPLIRERFNYPFESRQYHDFDIAKLRFPFESDETFNINKYILSSRIRITRNLATFTFPTFSTRAERRRVENKFKKVFEQFSQTNDLFNGIYHRLSNTDEREQEKLFNDGVFLFKPIAMNWLSSGVCRDWPDGRAIYINSDKSVYAWINQKDHLRFVSWSKNNAANNLRSVVTNFVQGINSLEDIMKTEGISFAHDDHFGYLTTCPSNIGTGLKYNVYLKLPNLTKDRRFPTIIKDLHLTMNEIMDPDAEAFKDCIDVSNQDRIGKTEIEIIQHVLNGVTKLIEIERHLESGNKLDDYLKQ